MTKRLSSTICLCVSLLSAPLAAAQPHGQLQHAIVHWKRVQPRPRWAENCGPPDRDAPCPKAVLEEHWSPKPKK